jgi:hypothetical protein
MSDNLKAQAMAAIDRDQTLNLERPMDPAEMSAMERLKRLSSGAALHGEGQGHRRAVSGTRGQGVARVPGSRCARGSPEGIGKPKVSTRAPHPRGDRGAPAALSTHEASKGPVR